MTGRARHHRGVVVLPPNDPALLKPHRPLMDCAGTALLSPIRSIVHSLSKATPCWAMLVVVGCSLLSRPLVAEEPVSFYATVRPILKEHCWHCHGEEHE
ncbi:MAG: hypothetical protein ACK53L_03905, partial [Pirellulaceae bacterium]